MKNSKQKEPSKVQSKTIILFSFILKAGKHDLTCS